MQFSMIALFATFAGAAMAGPMSLHMIRDCDVAGCAVALGPNVVSCTGAVVEAGANPIADAGCLASTLKNIADIPAPCTACAAELGISGPLDAASSAVNGVIDDAESAVDSFTSIF